MRDAITQMRSHLGVNQVGLVMRWNKRSDMIWTIFSKTIDTPDAHNIPPTERTLIDRRNGDGNGDNEVFTPSTSRVAQIGCHAEEIMIANWTHYELDAAATVLATALGEREPAPWSREPLRTEKFRLREVDLVLSKSPCTGPGGSQPLVCGVHTYGTSCAMKLYQFCSLPKFADVQWRIFYCALPPEKAETRFIEKPPPDKANKKQLKQHSESQKKRFESLQANITPRSGLGAIPNDFAGRSQFGSLIGLALSGIAKLNQLPNVTCEPLQDS